MDKKQGSDDVVERTVDDDDTEAQRFTHRAIPDEDPGPEELAKRNLEDDEDDTEGQRATFRY